MIDIYDCETLVKIYRLLNKKCDSIDNFINKHAFSFECASGEYGTENICHSIIDLMTRKNQLINLKIILDTAVETLNDEDRKIIEIKMHYSLTVDEICGVLELGKRTAFRHIERAFANLTQALNGSKYLPKLENIIDSEVWIVRQKDDIRARRSAFKTVMC